MTRNPSLQGLRGLAVGLVLVYHLHRAVVTGGFAAQLDPSGVAYSLLELCSLGVELFFMISGYLITASLVRHGDIGRFLANRVVRIYPVFLVAHAILFTAGPLTGYAWMGGLSPRQYALHFLSNLLFLPGVFDLPIAQIVAWSLSYELAFYLLAAAAFMAIRTRLSTAARAVLALAWAAAAGAFLTYHPRAWYFVAGVTVYFIGDRPAGWWRHSWSASLTGSAALVAMAATCERFFPLSVCCGGVAFAAVVSQRGVVAKALRARAIRYLGDVSYSLYLWHPFVLMPLKRVFAYGGGLIPNATLNFAAFCLVSVGLSVAVAHVSHAWIEVWFTNRWLRGRAVAVTLTRESAPSMNQAAAAPPRAAA